jgi:localization factor PodJL
MRHVPWRGKGVRPAAQEAAGDAARRSGLSIGAAFAMIRKDIQELRRQTSRPQVEPAVLEQQLNELAAQVGALQGATSGDSAGPGQDAFLRQLKGVLSQNLALLQQQVASTAANAISGPAESIRRDVASLKEIQASVDRRTQDTFEAVYGTIERIVDRLASIEEELRDRNPGANPAATPGAIAGPASQRPADSTPSGNAPSDDDAYWAALLPAVRPAPAPQALQRPQGGPGMMTGGTPALTQPSGPGQQALMLRQPAGLPDDAAFDPEPEPPSGAPEPDLDPRPFPAERSRWLQGRVVALGAGATLLMLVVLAFTFDVFRAPAESAGDRVPVAGVAAGPDAGPAQEPSRQEPSQQETSRQEGPSREQARAAEPAPEEPPVGRTASFNGVPVNLSPLSDGAAPPADHSVWGAEDLMRNWSLPAQPGHDPWPAPPSGAAAAADLAAAPLPAAIGGKALIAAAQAGDPDAAYEVAVRFAQSRNAADLAKSAAWLDRAAQTGLAPAQFRLGSMYEKGQGVRKDVAEARRLYVAAAEKGHAKAMHNLAVLYAHGINGAPDYAAAVEWFRKAAAYGTIDSQYNLGILYARGTGIERDLVESYKWFVLASKGGDKDAAHKRDEVGKALDPKQIEAAKAAADAFVTMPQPDEATVVRTPAGGWDQTAAATSKSKPPARPERSSGK